MKIAKLERKFKYNSITLPDPNIGLSPDAVREFYSAQYPELASAMVEGPVTNGNASTWTFVRAAGSKGRVSKRKPKPESVMTSNSAEQIIARALHGEDNSPTTLSSVQMANANRLLTICTKRVRSTAMPLPSSAFGIWG